MHISPRNPTWPSANPSHDSPLPLRRPNHVAAQQVAGREEDPCAWCLPPIEHSASTPHPRGEMMQFFFPQMIDQDSNPLVPMLASVGAQVV